MHAKINRKGADVTNYEKMIEPEKLISDCELLLGGKVSWREPIPERGPGIYIISVANPSIVDVDHLPPEHRPFWRADETIVYIGRSKHLRRRLREFYSHKYGDRKPHAGGQAILNLVIATVHWAAAADYVGAEDKLIKVFEKATGAKPFGNRIASARQQIQTDTLPPRPLP